MLAIIIKALVVYMLIINLVGFMCCYIDKRRAIKKQYRIKEKTLFIIAFIGGSVGFYIGMKKFRHKTLHKSFTIGIPMIILLQVIIVSLVLYFK